VLQLDYNSINILLTLDIFELLAKISNGSVFIRVVALLKAFCYYFIKISLNYCHKPLPATTTVSLRLWKRR